jgi:hypothetical protein
VDDPPKNDANVHVSRISTLSMGRSLPNRIRRASSAILAVVAFVGIGVSLSGCPVAAELENPDRFPVLKGAAGSGAVDCKQDLPPDGPTTPGIMCDYADAMKDHCARAGCHNNASRSAELDLTVDTLLIARILDEPSKHIISCTTAEGGGQCNPSNALCAAKCVECPSGPTDVLLSKASPGTGWIIDKMEEFDFAMPSSFPTIGCGTAMPYPPGNTGFTEARKQCLKDFFTWIANNGRPCSIPMGGSGSGGSATGGASGGTAGSGSGGGGAGGT